MKQLLVIAGKDKDRKFTLPARGEFPLGRGGTAENRLNDLKISRDHAVINVQCRCGQQLLARDRYAGAQVRCPNCGELLQLPGRPTVVRPVGRSPGRPATLDEDGDEPVSLSPPLSGGYPTGATSAPAPSA